MNDSEVQSEYAGETLDERQGGSCVYVKRTVTDDFVWGTAKCSEKKIPMCQEQGIEKQRGRLLNRFFLHKFIRHVCQPHHPRIQDITRKVIRLCSAHVLAVHD